MNRLILIISSILAGGNNQNSAKKKTEGAVTLLSFTQNQSADNAEYNKLECPCTCCHHVGNPRIKELTEQEKQLASEDKWSSADKKKDD